MKKINKKGFTLVELLVAISILGLIMVIAIPQLSNIKSSNKTTQYKKYAETMLTSGKLYTDSYTEDMFGNNQIGCVDISYNEMKEKDLLKDIKLNGDTCSSEDTYIRVRKANDHYLYETSVYCKDKSGKVVYDKRLNKNACDGEGPDVEGPKIEITPNSKNWTTGKNETVKVIIWDEYGMLENTKINLIWNKNGEPYKESIPHNFKNKRYDGAESNKLSYELMVPQDETGEFTLTVAPVDVRDSLGNYQSHSKTSGVYKLDNTAPTVPTTISMYKWTNNSTTPTDTTGLDSYTNDSWTNKYVFTTPSGSEDAHVGGVYYQYKTTGETENETNVKAVSRNVKKQGVSYIQWRACDALGNCSDYTANKTIKLDLTPPTCTVTGGNTTWINASSNPGSRTITASCNDIGGSGCVTADFSKTYSSNINTTTAGAVDNNSGGKVKDGAGNETSCLANQTVKIDKAPPTCSVTGGNSSWIKSGSRTITATCNDTGGSGCAKESFSHAYSSDINTTKAGANGNNSGGSFKDAAGNSVNCSANQTVKIDTTKPTISVTLKNESGTVVASGSVNDQSITRTASGSDSGSGLARIEYKTTGNWATLSSTTTTFSADSVNDTTYFRAVDNAGNVSDTNTTVVKVEKNKDKDFNITCTKTCSSTCRLDIPAPNTEVYYNDSVWKWSISGAGSGVDTSKLEILYSTQYVTNYCTYNYSNQPKGTRSGCGRAILNSSELWFSRSYAKSNIVGRACTNKGVCDECWIYN